jgi:hypothetical protein
MVSVPPRLVLLRVAFFMGVNEGICISRYLSNLLKR